MLFHLETNANLMGEGSWDMDDLVNLRSEGSGDMRCSIRYKNNMWVVVEVLN